MATKKTTCVVYSRVSTEQQTNESQIADLQAYAKYMKFKVLDVFEEKISGKTKAIDRLAFRELINYTDTHTVDNILVWELSRLGRNLRDVLTTIDYLTERHINVYAKKENINTLNDDKTVNNTAQMILGIMGSVAQYERTTIVERSKRGLHHHLKTGGAFSLSPYGYSNQNSKIVVDKKQAKVVKEIFRLFIGGMASPTISKYLNQKNVPTKKGVQWSDVQIRAILHNPMYYGQRKYNFGFVEVPAIVRKSDHLKALQIFESNRYLNKDKAIFSNPLSGLIVCGECGLNYFQHARQSKKDFAYKCMSHRKVVTGQLSEKCGNNSIGINLLNSMVYNSLFTILIEFSKHADLENYINKFNKSLNKEVAIVKKEIGVIKNVIENSSNKLNRLTELLVSNVIDVPEYTKQKHIIENGIETNSKRLNQLLINESNLNQSQTNMFISGLEKHLKKIHADGVQSISYKYEMGIELYKNFIQAFVTSIVINKGKVTDNANLESTIPALHKDRITKVTVNTLFAKYEFYTVAGFNMYSFQLLNNKLHKIEIVEEVSQ